MKTAHTPLAELAARGLLIVKVASAPPLGELVALAPPWDNEPARLPRRRGLTASPLARVLQMGELAATEDLRLDLVLPPPSSALRLRLGLRLLRLLRPLLLLLPALAVACARIFAA